MASIGVAFISVALAFISAFFAGILWRFCLLLGLALPHRPGAELQVSGLFLQFMCAPLHVLVVLLCVVVGASLVFWSFLVIFSSSPLPLFHFVYYYASFCFFFFFSFFPPLSSWLCVTGAWDGAGFGGRGSWLGCG